MIKILITHLTVRFAIIYHYVDRDVKVRDHCHITGKYKYSAHKDCKFKVKLNHKIPFCIPQPKVSWLTSYYARTKQIQF